MKCIIINLLDNGGYSSIFKQILQVLCYD